MRVRALYRIHRTHTAVCYLNSYGKDFKGGVFSFKDGEPSSIIPVAGDVLIYTADNRNVHSVDEVLDGERLTLTLWFTRNHAHDEDARLISFLSKSLSAHSKEDNPFLPLPASDNMYWFSDGIPGFDIRCARIHNLGFRLWSFKEEKTSKSDMPEEPLELLNMPVHLGRGDDIFGKIFINSLHALQVVQFYHLKASTLIASNRKQVSKTESAELRLLKNVNGLDLILPCDHQLAAEMIGFCIPCDHETLSFDWDTFAVAVTRWEEYMRSLYKELLILLPRWVTHEAIFLVPSTDP